MMRLKFWGKAESPVAAPSGECEHLWSNWSAPEECDVRTYMMFGSSSPTERVGIRQDRYCLHCNLYQRTLS